MSADEAARYAEQIRYDLEKQVDDLRSEMGQMKIDLERSIEQLRDAVSTLSSQLYNVESAIINPGD